MAAREQSVRIEVRFAVQLGDSLGNHVGMLLLFGSMFEKFLRNRLRMNSLGHVVVTLVAQDANDLSGQRLVQHPQNSLSVPFVTISDCAALNVRARPPADLTDVGQK